VQWNSQKLFHLFIGVHLYVRTVSFGLLCFFSLTQSNAWCEPAFARLCGPVYSLIAVLTAARRYPLSVMLYTLPEFLILTVYQLLFFQWLEIFVFSHEQVGQRVSRRRPCCLRACRSAVRAACARRSRSIH
jgi:hypothetical protein